MARKLIKRQGKQQADLGLKIDDTALYIRVSTELQKKEGNSLDAQRDKLLAHCEGKGWHVSEQNIYVDGGISGKSTEGRDAFNAMMEAAKQGKINRIVVTKRDRFARNTIDFLTNTQILTGLGVALVCLDIDLDTSTPVGKFISTIFAGFAEWEASLITDRVMTGKVHNAKQGGYNGARCPLGYDYDGKVFTPNKDADTVKLIFSLYADGKNLSAIADQLNATATPTASGGKWYPATVKYILRNGFYAGLAQWDGVEETTGTHPAIIERATYEAAQARLKAVKPGPQQR